MELPSITVVTPSYNQGGYIAETIRSVAEQNYPNLEHLVIDAKSTDQTLEVLAGFAHLPDLRWISEKDRGQSDAINKGIRMAQGEIVGWLNSDDYYHPGALQAIGRAFAENPGAGLVYGAGTKVNADGSVQKEIPFRPFDRRRLRSAFYILQPSMFFRRDLFTQVGGLTESLHYAMDWELLLKFPKNTPMVAIPEKIAQLRCYPNTKTSTGGWQRMQEIAGIGRQFHGPLDINYLSFCARRAIAPLHNRALQTLVDKACDRVFGVGRYMVDGWPDQ